MTADPADTAAEESPAGAGASEYRETEASGRRWGRIGSAALGVALVALGARRRSLGGAALALAGGVLSYRALRGRGRFGAPDSGEANRDPGEATGDRRGATASDDATTVAASVTVGKSADELSAFLRDAENLDRIAGPFADVTAAGEDRQRWAVRAPLDRRLTWETQISEADSGDRLRWEPTDGTPLFDELSATFRPAPGDRGTRVTLRLRLNPPGGAPARKALERLDVVPETLGGTLLDRLKSLAETGEIPTTEGNPSARGRGDLV